MIFELVIEIGHNEEVFSPSTEIEKILVIHSVLLPHTKQTKMNQLF